MITTPSNYSSDALYKKNMSWALWGSIAYELLLLVHRSMLFSSMSFSSYGIVVSFLSLVHLISHVADWGATNSIPPLLPYFTYSKRSFNIMLKKYTLVVHMPILIVVTVGALYYFSTHASVMSMPGKVGFLGFLVITESARNFLRQFLYTVQATQQVVSIELGLLIVRIAVLWGVYFFGHYTLSPLILLYSHVIEMLVCNVLFAALMHKMYKKLPNDNDSIFPPQFFVTSVRIKFFNYLLRLSRNLFSSNFLTPLLAVHCGLATAGVFYFASKLAHALLSVVKVTIGYSGNGLLAVAKKQSAQTIDRTFYRLNKKILWISAPLMSSFLVTAPLMTSVWYRQELHYHLFMISTLFLLMNIIECFFILYECLFILHHAAGQLFCMKIVELMVFYVAISYWKATSPYLLLISTILLRSMTLTIVIIQARYLMYQDNRA